LANGSSHDVNTLFSDQHRYIETANIMSFEEIDVMPAISAQNRFGRLFREWRRARGMTQDELSVSANVSARHISFIENGKSKPSRALVVRIAEALDIPQLVRNDLLSAAGFEPSPVPRSYSNDGIAPVSRALDYILGSHEPYPAFAVDRLWNVVRANNAASNFFSRSTKSGDTQNLMRILLAPGPFRRAAENWTEIAETVLTQLRNDPTRSPGDRELESLYEEAFSYAGDIRVTPDTREIPVLSIKLRFDKDVLSMFLTRASFGAAKDIALRDLSIAHIFPADATTESHFRCAAREE
jgi:transcriptional regulator with XRE-family HTH domain